MLKTLKELCALPGASGREDKVREYIIEKAQPYANEIKTDAMGNVLVFKKVTKQGIGTAFNRLKFLVKIVSVCVKNVFHRAKSPFIALHLLYSFWAGLSREKNE